MMELKIYNPQEDGFLQNIDWNFEDLKNEITDKADLYMNLVYSDTQIKDAKKDRADLRKFITALENKRKEIKKQVMIPYEGFELKEKELVSIIDKAVSNIDKQVKAYEEGVREEKKKKIKKIYEECIGDLDRTIPLERIFKDSWLNVGTTLKSIQEEISGTYEKVKNELQLISNEDGAYTFDMKEAYLKSFDMNMALEVKQQLQEAEKKRAEYEARVAKEKQEEEERRKEEALEVANAGKTECIEKALDDEKETSEDVPGLPDRMPEDPNERTVAITFRAVAKESSFFRINELLKQLSQWCEEFKVVKKEEL